MTDSEILKKAAEKAMENGFNLREFLRYETIVTFDFHTQYKEILNPLIFSHDFAKKFWGEMKQCPPECNGLDCKDKGWQYHLQQMVLEPEPLLYLKRFLDE